MVLLKFLLSCFTSFFSETESCKDTGRTTDTTREDRAGTVYKQKHQQRTCPLRRPDEEMRRETDGRTRSPTVPENPVSPVGKEVPRDVVDRTGTTPTVEGRVGRSDGFAVSTGYSVFSRGTPATMSDRTHPQTPSGPEDGASGGYSVPGPPDPLPGPPLEVATEDCSLPHRPGTSRPGTSRPHKNTSTRGRPRSTTHGGDRRHS